MGPLEQLNLMLWLVWAPQGVLHQDFELQAIGPSLALDPALQRALQQSGFRPKNMVSPDLLLCRRGAPLWKMVECKTSSFSESSSTASQAAAMLLLTSKWFAQARGILPKEVNKIKVCYAVTGGQEAQQQAALAAIERRLKPLPTNPAGAFGIYAISAPIRLQGVPQAFCFPTPQEVDLPPEGVYPLLPIDPSVNAKDEKGRRDLQERLRSYFVAWMGKHLPQAVNQTVSMHLETDILLPAIPVWDVWEDGGRRWVRHFARKFIRKLLKPLEKQLVEYLEDPPGHVWHFRVSTPDKADIILRHLTGASSRSTEMDTSSDQQLPLLDV